MVEINPCFFDTEAPSHETYVISVSLYIIATVFGYALNVYLIAVFIKGWKIHFSKDHFYRQSLESSIASLLYLLSYAIVAIPYTVLNKPYLPQPALIFFASIRVFAFYLSIYLSLEVAIDRTLLFYDSIRYYLWTKLEV
ncbi:unnamed protein product [Toxocara canis]|uniref:7TM_GPCR_Srx domain-containing protein n=1 Tax=Toxocara canis TaxID=6265 RepID=A0A183V665_TOXCA|nr:unnamed protein product [Toxocara canis]